MSNIEKFKKDILFKEIHLKERSDKLEDKIEIADTYIRISKEGRMTKNLWYKGMKMDLIVPIFEIIASEILYHEKLLLLNSELEKSNYKPYTGIDFSYYNSIFKNRIKNAEAILRKLRPYILEETKEYSIERKQMDLKGRLGRFYKGWYGSYKQK